MTELIESTGSNLIPAFASIVTALITLVTLAFVRETKGQPLASS